MSQAMIICKRFAQVLHSLLLDVVVLQVEILQRFIARQGIR